MDTDGDIVLRRMEKEDCDKLLAIFSPEHSIRLYTSYYEEQESGKRDVIIACSRNEIVGYVTIIWESNYEDFREQGIPEIKDIRVVEHYRRTGIATKLMDEAEVRIAEKATFSSAGVGLAEEYEAAQNLYAKRGYVPDGKGVFYMESYLIDEQLEVSENQGLMMIKPL
ncbi:GNAT family N-acetyltransferase [Sporanaerobium hydrogeniformans]|uniref:GNAT family N-acetyltransferase n=1 Tax=Sporanaerobium hydrogeniformans TaxID=3072179 RepID=A0AC61DFH7_9FIRM|nr:GNAT family N-acetyltransferase [Sporanaerobium hydrogeniformans]PHV71630.1 GNAT family N-acetyltransferase [Sporanaerobium hydrogeniformans]